MNLERLQPLRDCILVRRIKKDEEKTAGGIYIPDAAKDDQPQFAAVVAVGTGKVTKDGTVIPLQVKKGDLVFFGKFAGTDAGKDLLVLREDDVLGIIQE